jgi:hypothetical protein
MGLSHSYTELHGATQGPSPNGIRPSGRGVSPDDHGGGHRGTLSPEDDFVEGTYAQDSSQVDAHA